MREISQEKFDKAAQLFDRIAELNEAIKAAPRLARKIELIREKQALIDERLRILYA